ncbi:hypothetical protein ABZP36_003558 [Zizania latifolia]
MASADAILSSQVAGESFKMNKYAASPVKVQVQKQSDGSSAAGAAASGGRRQQAVKLEKNSSAAVGKQLKPRFAVELDGLNCFETLVPR